MQIFVGVLNLSGNCPGEAKSRFTASASRRSTPNYYPPSNYELRIHSLGRLNILVHTRDESTYVLVLAAGRMARDRVLLPFFDLVLRYFTPNCFVSLSWHTLELIL